MSETETTETEPVEPAQEVDETTETEETAEQDDAFDAATAREKIRKVNAEAKALRERAKKAEAERDDNAGNSEKVTALESENLRLRVAVKHGLPESLAKRLTGTTEDELLQDAEELMNLFGDKKPPTQQPREKLRGGGGDPTVPSDPMGDPDKFMESVMRR